MNPEYMIDFEYRRSTVRKVLGTISRMKMGGIERCPYRE